MKITLLVAALTGIGAVAIAGGATKSVNPFSGFYVGAGVTAVSDSMSQDAYVDNALANSGRNASSLGVGGQLHFGYDYALANNWTLGLDVFGNLPYAKLTATEREDGAVDTVTTFKERWEFGIDEQLGYVVKNNLFYVLAGPSWVNMQLYNDGAADDAGTYYSGWVAHTTFGATVGLGAEQAISKHLRIKEQYALGIYGGKLFTLPSDPGARAINASNRLNQTAMLALDYQF